MKLWSEFRFQEHPGKFVKPSKIPIQLLPCALQKHSVSYPSLFLAWRGCSMIELTSQCLWLECYVPGFLDHSLQPAIPTVASSLRLWKQSTVDLQGCELTNGCCFKLLSLWYFLPQLEKMNTPTFLFYYSGKPYEKTHYSAIPSRKKGHLYYWAPILPSGVELRENRHV